MLSFDNLGHCITQERRRRTPVNRYEQVPAKVPPQLLEIRRERDGLYRIELDHGTIRSSKIEESVPEPLPVVNVQGPTVVKQIYVDGVLIEESPLPATKPPVAGTQTTDLPRRGRR